MGDFPRATLFSFSDRVRQEAVQLKRRDMLNPLPENLQNPPDLCALATMNAMEKYPELLRSDLEETERHKKVPDGYLVNFPPGPRPTPPPPRRISPPPQPAAPGDWVSEGGRKRRSKKRKSRKRKSRKRKSKKRKSRKRKSRKRKSRKRKSKK